MNKLTVSYEYDSGVSGVWTAEETRSCIKITPVREAGTLTLKMSIPLIDIHAIWAAKQPLAHAAPQMSLPWRYDFSCGAHQDAPIFSLLNLSNENRCTVALTDWIDDAHFLLAINQEKCTYDLTVIVSLCSETLPFSLIVDQTEGPLPDRVRAWRQDLHVAEGHYPASVWEPVYCTWYAVHGAVTQDWVEKNADQASKLGCKTLIIDDGWSYDERKRVTPETIKDWYRDVADWSVSPAKFPDFDAHVERVQKMGMKYLLWVAPYLIGRQSRFLAEHPACTTSQPLMEGHLNLDPADQQAVQAMLEQLKTLFSIHHLDGLKVDFLDIVPPDVHEPCGRKNERFIRQLSQTLKDIAPEALIEFRQSYATPGMQNYGTQFRAGDVPFDFLLNFARILQIRILMGDNIPVHADPAYWHPEESTVNAARHMIAMMAAVPMLSMELTTLPETHKNVIRFWLDFYNAHRSVLNHGKWNIGFLHSEITFASAVNGQERIVILRDPARLEEALSGDSAEVTWILNLSDAPIPLKNGSEFFTPEGKPSVPGTIPVAGCGSFKCRQMIQRNRV